MKRSHKKIIKKVAFLLAVLLFVQLAGVFGSLFNFISLAEWYPSLNKPAFNPPGWIFGPVWTLLYLTMGWSFYLILKKRWSKKKRQKAVVIFLIQWILNIAWSFLFFGLQSPVSALFEIILLWLAILWTIKVFYELNKTAAYWLVPYWLWVSFALILNANIVMLN